MSIRDPGREQSFRELQHEIEQVHKLREENEKLRRELAARLDAGQQELLLHALEKATGRDRDDIVSKPFRYAMETARDMDELQDGNQRLITKLRYVRRHLDRFRDWAVQLNVGGMELVVDHLERSIDEVLPADKEPGAAD